MNASTRIRIPQRNVTKNVRSNPAVRTPGFIFAGAVLVTLWCPAIGSDVRIRLVMMRS